MSVVYACLVALALAAPPTRYPPPPPHLPPGIGGRSGGHPGRDFLSRLHSSMAIARGSVRPAVGLTEKDVVLPVHVDAWLKGGGGTEIRVNFGALRPVTTEGQSEIFFLGGALADAGAELRCLQEHNEHWEVPDGASARIDQAVSDAISGAPESHVEAELMGTGPTIAQEAANSLGLLASINPAALADADAATRDPQNLPAARAELIRFLPSRLPLPTLVASAEASQPPVVRLASLESLGRAAAHDLTKQQAAQTVLNSAAADPDLEVKLAAAKGLAQLQSGDALPPIDAVLNGSDRKLRATAVLILGELAHGGSKDAESRLEVLQADTDLEVAKRAASQLAMVHPPAAASRRSWIPVVATIAAAAVVLGLLLWRRRQAAR